MFNQSKLVLDNKKWLKGLNLLLLAGSLSVTKADQFWNGGGADNFWNTAANWGGGTLPNFSTAINFGGTVQTSTENNLATDTTIGGINFINTINGQAFTLTGNRIILGGNIVTTTLTGGDPASVIENRIEFDMLLNGNRTFTTASSTTHGVHNLTITGIIGETGGSRGITKNGTTLGVLTLSGLNTFTGSVTLTSGIISFNTIANAGTPSALGAGGAIITGNSGGSTGTLRYTGTGHSTNRQIQIGTGTDMTSTVGVNIAAEGSGALVFNNPFFNALFSTSTATKTLTLQGSSTQMNTISGVIRDNNGGTGLISLTKAGTGTWRLTGVNTYTGTTSISGGLLLLENAAALPGGVAATGGTSGLLFSGSGSNGGVLGLTAATGDFLRLTGTTSPASDRVGWASGATGGFAAFGGDRVVNFGGTGSSVTWSPTGGVFGSGLILGHSSSDSTITVVNGIALNSGTRTFIVNDGSAAVDAILSGAITGTASSIIKQGAGTLALTGTNTFGQNITSGTTFVTISAGVLQIGNGGTAGSLTGTGTGDIQNDAVLAFNRSNAVTVQYVIKGSGIVRQAGTGTTTLTGVNTYTGGTQVQSGALLFGNQGSLPGVGAVSVSAGAMLAFRVGTTPDTFAAADLAAALAGTLAGGVTFASGAIIGLDTTPGDFTYNTGFADQSLGLGKLGPNRLTLTGAANSGGTGITRLSGGVLDVGALADGLLPTGGLFFSGDAVLQGNGTFTRTFSGSSTAAGTNQITGTSGGFSARGGTLTVNFGGNATPSSITISTGNARLGNNFVFGSATADSRVVVLNPLTLNTATRTFTVNSGVGGDSAELQGVISSTDATDGIIKAGPGLLILSANNTYTGATTISNGTLQLGTGGTTGAIASTSTVTNNGVLVFNRNNATSPTYPISGSGQVRQIGTGVTSLGAVNTYGGGTLISAGVLTFLNTSARPAAGGVTVEAGATLGLGVGASPAFFTTVDLDDLFAGSLSAVTNDAASLVGIDTTAGDFAYGSSIPSTTRGLVKLGANTLSLSGTNSYTGLTQVNAGVLRLDSAGAIPGGIGSTGGQSNISFNGGIIALTPESGNFTRGLGSGAGQVRWLPSAVGGFAAFGGNRTVNFGGNATPSTVSWFNGGTQGVFGSALVLGDSEADSTVTILNPISLNNSNSNRTITVNDGSAAIDAVLAGVVSSLTTSGNGTRLIKNGAGTLALTAANTYVSGNTFPGTTISAGTLMLGNGGSTGSLQFIPTATGFNSDVSIASGATFAFNRSDAALSIANLITGAGQVRQVGAGSATLGNANTYSGGTTVAAGTLIVTNTTGSGTGTGPVTVNAGAALGGTGTLAPTGSNGITVSGEVAPGLLDSIGTLTLAPENGNAEFLSSSSLLFQLGGNGVNDRLIFDSTGTGLIDFSAITAGSIKVSLFPGYTPALWDSFDLIDWSALSMNGLSPSMLDFSGAELPDSNWEWDTSAFVSSGTISVSLVPEPGRMMLCLMAGLVAVFQRRRSDRTR